MNMLDQSFFIVGLSPNEICKKFTSCMTWFELESWVAHNLEDPQREGVLLEESLWWTPLKNTAP